MVVRMGMVRHRPDLTTDAFRKHWREPQGPLAAKLPGLRHYHQSHVADREQRGVNFPDAVMISMAFPSSGSRTSTA